MDNGTFDRFNVYIVGMSIYLILQQIKKLLNKRRDLKFQERRDRNG